MFYIDKIVDTSNIWYPEDMLKSYEEKDWRVIDGRECMINYKDQYMKQKLQDAKSKYDNVREAFNDNIKLIKTKLDDLYQERILFQKCYRITNFIIKFLLFFKIFLQMLQILEDIV